MRCTARRRTRRERDPTRCRRGSAPPCGWNVARFAHVPIRYRVTLPAEAMFHFIHELVVALVDSEHVHIGEIRLCEGQAFFVHIEGVEPTSPVVVDGHGELLGLEVPQEAVVRPRSVVEILERNCGVSLMLLRLEERDRSLYRLSQNCQGRQVRPRGQLGDVEREVAGVHTSRASFGPAPVRADTRCRSWL